MSFPVRAHELRGKVTARDNSPLEGVGIYNQNTKNYTYSNDSGYFELNDVSQDDILNFHSLGYETLEYRIRAEVLNTTVQIVMEEAAVSLDQVVLTSGANAWSRVVSVDLATQPVKSSQEVLRKVPGLIIGQHAGGGKAEQLFLRGFDIDHGTDLALEVDGMPVNMVSHAHGQGYSDLHFVIPETIAEIDFGKGPYYTDKGNFATAGYVELRSLGVLDSNKLSLEAGQYNTLRLLSLQNLVKGESHNAYLASELLLTDGVFESPQNFNRLNLMGKYTFDNKKDQQLSLAISHFNSKWNASGQIPQRAVNQMLISRFGAIDDTEGGTTGRSNVWLRHRKIFDEHSSLRSSAYLSRYDFELYSNFTFFLEDPENGDQIRQRESRTLLGAQTSYRKDLHLEGNENHLEFEGGIGFRYDDANGVELSHTKNRQELLERLAYGNIDELNTFGYAKIVFREGKWTINPGLRLDYFKFDYQDLAAETYVSQSEEELFASPKLNIMYNASPGLQLFAKSGIGFHSNDTRAVVSNEGSDILPAAYGIDLGVICKPVDRLVINAALWGLWLEQEFVYVGDAGIVEPSGKSRRLGLDFGVRYELTDWLYLNGDINYTYARSTEEPAGSDFIPLAPDLSSAGGIALGNLGNFYGGLQYRYVHDRPANEDSSLVAEGYFVTDANVNYQLGNWSVGIIVENLFDTAWNETQFATQSRLREESSPVEEIHFTPGAPFFVRGRVSVSF
jgi:hypothetical protein